MKTADITIFLILPLLGYLLGAIPFGYIIGRSKGIDIRSQGSGNIGSTNVGRVLGKRWGYICFLLDVGKGLVPVLYAGNYLRQILEIDTGQVLPLKGQLAWMAVGAACILGHMFSIYLRFRGGKGVATSLGVVLGIWPYFTLAGVMTLAVWVGIWGLTRYVSLASITAAVMFPTAFLLLIWRIPGERWEINQLFPLLAFSCLMAILVIIRHRSNIKRLLDGTELKGGKPKEV
ncbi:MAG: glycerol-3-phosphate 1-O-acyltransferase PlsY [Sedimentisphaerales bacterium]|nr:glycerol-3-phosphate 1-O-acyltransferase PlsY [Sedimentisphaerales bacterium]